MVNSEALNHRGTYHRSFMMALKKQTMSFGLISLATFASGTGVTSMIQVLGATYHKSKTEKNKKSVSTKLPT